MDTDKEAREGAAEADAALTSDLVTGPTEAEEEALYNSPPNPIVGSYQLRVTQRNRSDEESTRLTNDAMATLVRELLESVTGGIVTVTSERLDK